MTKHYFGYILDDIFLQNHLVTLPSTENKTKQNGHFA
jgi:hypothetical protein